MFDRLLRETEAARKLGLSPKTLRNWRVAGSGPPFKKIGGAIRYHPDDLEEFIARGHRTSTSDRGLLSRVLR